MEVLVAADDRTGAFEAAAALADRGNGSVPVVVWPGTDALGKDDVAVIDLGSRHLSPGEAAQRAASIPGATVRAHKTDSTLRGNWADELVARAADRPVLLVPALPVFGRICRGGIVLDHDRPVDEGAASTDVRRRVLTARPSEALRAAGAARVVELADPDAVSRWLDAPVGLAVADADTDVAIAQIACRWERVADEVVLAGPSAVVSHAGRSVSTRHEPAVFPGADGPVLVVCGSVHPAARAQLDAAQRRGVTVTSIADDPAIGTLLRDGVLVLATEIPVGDVTEPMAVATAASLARGAHELSDRVRIGALVVIGGDTASAVIGDTAVAVHGSVDPGTAWMRADGFDAPVVTRSGGFGHERALVDLIARLAPR